jgi:hypothetical protein
MSKQLWYVIPDKTNAQVGPFASGDIKWLWSNGKLRLNDLIHAEGWGEPKTAVEISASLYQNSEEHFDYFQITDDGQRKGPFSVSQLADALARGAIAPTDVVEVGDSCVLAASLSFEAAAEHRRALRFGGLSPASSLPQQTLQLEYGAPPPFADETADLAYSQKLLLNEVCAELWALFAPGRYTRLLVACARDVCTLPLATFRYAVRGLVALGLPFLAVWGVLTLLLVALPYLNISWSFDPWSASVSVLCFGIIGHTISVKKHALSSSSSAGSITLFESAARREEWRSWKARLFMVVRSPLAALFVFGGLAPQNAITGRLSTLIRHPLGPLRLILMVLISQIVLTYAVPDIMGVDGSANLLSAVSWSVQSCLEGMRFDMWHMTDGERKILGVSPGLVFRFTYAILLVRLIGRLVMAYRVLSVVPVFSAERRPVSKVKVEPWRFGERGPISRQDIADLTTWRAASSAQAGRLGQYGGVLVFVSMVCEYVAGNFDRVAYLWEHCGHIGVSNRVRKLFIDPASGFILVPMDTAGQSADDVLPDDYEV